MPSARPDPAIMIARIASQIFDAATPPWNAGAITSSVTRPSTIVRAIEARANSSAPASEIMNGVGCSLTYERTNRIPRRNRPRSAISGVST